MKRIAIGCVLAAMISAGTPAESTSDLRTETFTLKSYNGRTIAAELARLRVPERHADPAGRSIEIAFVRLPTTAKRPGAPIVFLAGGPGGSGIRYARMPSYFEAFDRLRAVGDVILLDPRGVGLSRPALACSTTALPPPDVFASPDHYQAWAIEQSRRCRASLEASGMDLAAFNTVEMADDLEDLRRALGVPKISLLGFSYGTHLGLCAVRRHPEGLDRVVLVGTEGPDHTRKLPSSLDTQWRKLTRLAADDPAVRGFCPDLEASLRRVLAKLDREPVTVTVHIRALDRTFELPVGSTGLQQILLWDLGDSNDFPVFPALLHTIEQGDLELLTWFVTKRANQVGGVPAIVYLVDGASGASPERWARIEREAEGSLLGGSTRRWREMMEVWKPEPLGDEFRGPIVSTVPTLFVSGTLDSNAPPYQAEELRWGFTHATHLVVENAGHEDMLGSAEVDQAIREFLSGGDVAGRRIARPVPRFLSVEDAKRNRKGGG